MTLVPKNRHPEAAIAILGNAQRAKTLLRGLASTRNTTVQFIASVKGTITEALLLLHTKGATTTFLATIPTSSAQMHKVNTLICSGLATSKRTDSTLAQTVMGTHDGLLQEAYERAGFTPLATLTSMKAPILGSTPPSAEPLEHLTISSYLEFDDGALEDILLESYKGSLDCPAIHGVREIGDIIAGHKSVHGHDPSLWSIAKLRGKTSGVLLLNPVPEARCMDLTYLGVAPDARGKGVGDALLCTAINQSKERGLKVLSLAVDAQNIPAITLYKRWNFQEKGQRFTMIHKLC